MSFLEKIAAIQKRRSDHQSRFGNLDSFRLDNREQMLMDYYNKIKSYEGSQYWEQLINNPYINSQFVDSGLSSVLDQDTRFGGLLNFLTLGISGSLQQSIHNHEYDRFISEQSQAANEELTRMLSMMQQNQYNSPASQAAREKAAGINPDLAGVSGEAASSGAGPDETSTPNSLAAMDEQMNQTAGQIGSMCSSFIGGILNLAQFFQDFEGKSISNATGDIAFADSMYNYAVKAAAGMSSLPSTRAEYDALTEEQKLGADETVYETLQAATKSGVLGSMQLNRRARKMLKKMTGRVMYDSEGKPTLAFQAQRAAMLKGFYGDTLEAGKAAGHPVMSDPEVFASVLEKSVGFFGTVESLTREYTLKMQEISQKAASAQAASDVAQSEYNTALYTSELGSQEGASRSVEARFKEVQLELDKAIDEELNKLVKNLEDDGLWGKLGKIGIISLRAALKSMTASMVPMMNKAGQMKTGFGMSLQ